MERYEEQRLQRENTRILSRNVGTLLYYIYTRENGEN